MIDLTDWRRRRRQRRLCISWVIIGSCYVSFIVPALIYLSHLEHEATRLERLLAAQPSAEQAQNPVADFPLQTLNQLVWNQHIYMKQLLSILMHWPSIIVLQSIHCHNKLCEFDVVSHHLKSLLQAFKKRQLRDIKQGGCPRCYRAKIAITISSTT